MKICKLLFILLLGSVANACFAICDDSGSVPGSWPFDGEESVSLFLNKLQHEISKNDKAAVAELVYFPVLTELRKKAVRLDRKSLLSHFDEVFNEKVRISILAARFNSKSDHSCVFWNDSGMMVGSGEVWFTSIQGGIKIITVNN